MVKQVYVHPTSLVETEQLGQDTRIWAFTHILKNVCIGSQCNIGDHCYIESGVNIGDNVTIKNGNQIWEGVTLEDGVFVGPGVVFTNDLYPRSPRLPEASMRYSNTGQWLVDTNVKRGATLGAGAIILAGRTIGEFAMIGAGAVVTRNVPPYALIVGNPGQRRGWVCRCGQPLLFHQQRINCRACGSGFINHGEFLEFSSEEIDSI